MRRAGLPDERAAGLGLAFYAFVLGFALAEAEDAKYMAEMEKAGIKIVKPTDEQLAKIAAKIRKNTWPIMESVVGKEIMDKVLAGLAALR